MIPILAALSALALFGQVADPDLTALIPLAAELFGAIMTGGWWKAAAIVVAGLTLALRWLPWAPIRTVPGQVLGAFILAALGGLLNAMAAGASITVDVVTTALQIGAAAGTAAGGLTAIIAWWKSRTPPGGGAVAALLLAALLLPSGAVANVAQLGTGKEVTVTTTATALRDTSVDVLLSRAALACVPETEAATVYMGGVGVTVATGVPVPPGKCFSPGERLEPGVILYGVVASGSVKVRVQEYR